jgi:hypothetical protein
MARTSLLLPKKVACRHSLYTGEHARVDIVALQNMQRLRK